MRVVPLLNLLWFTAHTHKLLANQRSYQSSNLENHGYWPVPNISFKKWMNLQPGETAKEAAESTSAESLHRSSWDSRFVVDSLAEGLGIIFFLFGILSFSQLMPGKMDQKWLVLGIPVIKRCEPKQAVGQTLGGLGGGSRVAAIVWLRNWIAQNMSYLTITDFLE